MNRIKMLALATCGMLMGTLMGSGVAQAQDATADDELTVTGNVSLVSQYRLRGISLSDEEPTLQGGITVAHESGFYVGTWASGLAGFGSFGGSNTEIDLIAGFATPVGSATVDAGVIWYLYPGTEGTDFAEIYASATLPVGPASAKVGTFYAPSQGAIGDEDNLYLYTDWALPLGESPFTVKAHLGYTTGDGSTLSGPQGDYVDWLIGVDTTWKNLTLGLAYLDTDIPEGAATEAFFAVGGHDIVDDAVLATLTASF